MYEAAIFLVGLLVGGFAATKFNDYVWEQALKITARKLPAHVLPEFVAAVRHARSENNGA